MTISDEHDVDLRGGRTPESWLPTGDDPQFGATLFAASGFVATFLGAAAFAVPLALPFRTHASGASVIETLVERRELALATTLMYCVAAFAFLWFVAFVAHEFGRGSNRTLVHAAALGGTFCAGMLVIGQMLMYGLPLNDIAEADPTTVRMMVDLGMLVMNAGKWGVAVFLVGAAIAGYRTGAISARFAWVGIACSLFVTGSTIGSTFARDGLFEFGYAVETLGTFPVFGWIAALSLSLTRQRLRARKHPVGVHAQPITY